ncbi:MAG: T9SS C-terminal target domain-containing protein [Ignavibacteriae bacterium]|nr:MAG: T9SS C-terminal target domain-containing protein [Ignavibacteriota bacterium]
MKTIKLITILLFLLSQMKSISQTPIPFPGFPIKIDTLRSPDEKVGPIAADINRDGIKEIIAVGIIFFSGTPITSMLHVIQTNGHELQGYPKGYFQMAHDIAVGDVDNDGYIDIALRTNDSVDVLDHIGNHLQGFPLYYPTLTPVANWTSNNFINLYDLDGDGKLEIITCQYNKLAVFDYHGQMKPGWPGNVIGKVFSNPAIGDLDKDGKAEIVTTQFRQLSGTPSLDSASINIFRYNGAQFSNNWPIYYDSLYLTYLASPTIYIGNTAANSYIIAPVTKSNIMCKFYKFNLNAEITKTVYFDLMGYFNEMSMVMGDIDKDGQVEYATGGFDGGYLDLYVLNSQFNTMQGWPQNGSTDLRTPAIVKLTNGPYLNIISPGHYAIDDNDSVHGFIYGYSNSGVPFIWSPLRPLGYVHGLCVDDLNNDGSVEIISANEYTPKDFIIHIWTIPGVAYSHVDDPWPMYCHDRYKSNQYGFIPPDEPIGIQPMSNEIPNEFILFQNYPNPFNPATTIKYQVRTSSLINLSVFDIIGREVAALVNENLKPGTYSISFDGSNLSSGVYYYRLTSDGVMIDTKKMVMIK